MKFKIEQHKRNDGTRGMQIDGRYIEGYNPAYGTSRATIITIDGIEICVATATRNRGVWWIRDDKVELAPYCWARLARDLATNNVRRDSETGHLFCATTGAKILKHFVDSHDAEGNAVANGRASGLHFPLLTSELTDLDLGTVFMSGILNGQPVISVLQA